MSLLDANTLEQRETLHGLLGDSEPVSLVWRKSEYNTLPFTGGRQQSAIR